MLKRTCGVILIDTPPMLHIADMRIFASANSYLIDVPPRAWPNWSSMVKKYVNPRNDAHH